MKSGVYQIIRCYLLYPFSNSCGSDGEAEHFWIMQIERTRGAARRRWGRIEEWVVSGSAGWRDGSDGLAGRKEEKRKWRHYICIVSKDNLCISTYRWSSVLLSWYGLPMFYFFLIKYFCHLIKICLCERNPDEIITEENSLATWLVEAWNFIPPLNNEEEEYMIYEMKVKV